MSSKFYCLFFIIYSIFYATFCHAQEQPIPDWVKDIGGTGESKLAGIAVDKYDNVYIAGNFQGTLTVDHSGISNPQVLNSNGHYDIYIAKYTPDGKLLWAKSIGGGNLDQVNNLAVDKDGNVIIGGSFGSSSIDCNPGAGVFTLNSNGGDDAFVVKLDTNGNFDWARSVGSSSADRGHVVTTDKDGNVIFVGSYTSSLTVGNTGLTHRGGFDGFMVKYDQTGNIMWAMSLASSAEDEVKSVKTDSNGNIVIMGYFNAAINLDPRGSSSSISPASGETYYIAKYNPDGRMSWANRITGSSSKTISSIAIGPTDDIFVTGVFTGSINLNGAILNSSAGPNLFIAKYNYDGVPIWGKPIASTASNPYSYYITVDVDNNAYIGGFFDQTLTFNPGSSARILTYHGGRDTFFAKYSGIGDYQWAFNFGSACTGNFGHKIDVDSKKNILLGGAFCRTVDFNPGNCNLSLTAKHSTSDGYIAKFNQIKLTGEPLITKFELNEQNTPAIIDINNKKIIIAVKAGTDITKLKPVIETDIGVLNPLSGIETDFTIPKTYKITSNCLDYFWEVIVTRENLITVATCPGQDATLTGDNNNNGTYQWEILTNGLWTNASGNSNQSNYLANGFTNTTQSLIIISFRRKVTTNNTASYDSYILLAISPSIQNNSISVNQNQFCPNASTILIGSNAVSGTTMHYQWQKSIDNNIWTEISNATEKDLSISGITETTFFRRMVIVNNCIDYSNIEKIEILASPMIIINGNSFDCYSVTLTATGGTTYQWDGGLTPNQATNTFTTSGTYNVTVINASGCSTTISKTITIGAGQTNITGNTTGCNNVVLTASGGVTYQWDGGDNPNQAINTFTTSGTYNVTITDSNGCISTLQKTVTVNPSVVPILSINASTTTICAGQTINFIPTYTNAGTAPTFKWFKNGVQVATSINYLASRLRNEDEIHCEITGSELCSVPIISDKIKVTVNSLPVIKFDGDVTLENDGPKILSPQINETVISYSWAPTIGLDNPNIKNPRANPENTTTYTLTVMGEGGCIAQAKVRVVVLKEIFIPNVFSPNGDGKNDQWVIRNIADYIGTKVQIFNRYGQRIFHSDNFITPWDGMLGGNQLPIGSYYYILDLANKSKKRYTGSVTILR